MAMWRAIALLMAVCACVAANGEQTGQVVEKAQLRQENQRLRHTIAQLQQRVARLEHDTERSPQELIQTSAKRAPVDAIFEPDDAEMGEAGGKGRRGGDLSTEGSFIIADYANRAGNSEDMNEAKQLGQSNRESQDRGASRSRQRSKKRSSRRRSNKRSSRRRSKKSAGSKTKKKSSAVRRVSESDLKQLEALEETLAKGTQPQQASNHTLDNAPTVPGFLTAGSASSAPYQKPGAEGTCHPTCKTCAVGGHDPKNRRRKGLDCTSCKVPTAFVALSKFKTKGHFEENVASHLKSPDPNTKVYFGQCQDATTATMDTKSGVGCVYSKCVAPRTGNMMDMSFKYGRLDNKVLCTRICMFGGRATQVKKLQCNADENSKCTSRRTGKTRNVPTEFSSTLGWDYKSGTPFTSPVCFLYKLVLCTTPTSSTQKQKCAQGIDVKRNCEACEVKKEVSCHAIVPSVRLGTPPSAFTQAQRDMCKMVIDPCKSIARYA